jgi:AraC-like DNA-binding protein
MPPCCGISRGCDRRRVDCRTFPPPGKRFHSISVDEAKYKARVSWIRAAATRAVLAAAASRGLAPAEVLARAGGAALPAESNATIPLSVHFGVIETCMRLTRDPGFTVDIAQSVPAEAYDVVGFAMRSAPDLASAVLVGPKRHVEFFGVAPHWEAPLAEARIAASDLARPVVGADPTLHDFLIGAAERALAEHVAPDGFVEQARRAISELLPSGQLDAERLAARLGTTERTLRRRLAQLDSSFSELRDQVRSELAQAYLAERALPLPEIAFLLDFADERAFRRSFQRWTGLSPARFRAERGR